MKVFDTDAEYFLGSAEAADMGIDEAQHRAATFNEDQDEDPEASPEDTAHIYAITGMDPSLWGNVEDTSPQVVAGSGDGTPPVASEEKPAAVTPAESQEQV